MCAFLVYTSKTYLSYFIIQKDDFVKVERAIPLTELASTNGTYNLQLKLPEKTGRYILRVTFWSDDIVGTYNNAQAIFEIENK